MKVRVLVSLLSGQPLAANLGRVEGGANRWALILPVSLWLTKKHTEVVHFYFHNNTLHWRRSIRKSCSSFLSPRLQKLFLSPWAELLLGKWEWVSFVQSCLQISNSCHLTLRLGALTLTLIILCNSDLSDVRNVWFGRALWWALPLFPMMTDSTFDES